MKVFIGGSLGIKNLDDVVMDEFQKLINDNAEILVGDALGADTIVQAYFSVCNYENVTVYVSGDNVRENMGDNETKHIEVPSEIHGKEFYMQKDIAMANDCDCGFMLWNGRSKATFENIRRLNSMGKSTRVYLTNEKRLLTVKGKKDYINLLGVKGVAKLLSPDTTIKEAIDYCNEISDFEAVFAEYIHLEGL